MKPKAEKAGRAPNKKGKTENKKPAENVAGTRGAFKRQESEERTKGKDTAKEKEGKGAKKRGGGDGGGGKDKKHKPIESVWEERAHLNGGEVLPEDGTGFVDKVNELIDLVRYTELMLRGVDEKSSKSLLGQLLDIRYGKNARLAVAREDEPDKLTWNLPR